MRSGACLARRRCRPHRCAQAYINFGWGRRFQPWANMTEKGSTFSPSGRRLATVIWVHYVSKVRALQPGGLLPRPCPLGAGPARLLAALMAAAVQAYEFMDTLIMILRRKDQQISFLQCARSCRAWQPPPGVHPDAAGCPAASTTMRAPSSPAGGAPSTTRPAG